MKNLILAVSDLHFRKPFYMWLADQARIGKYGAVVIAGDLLDMLPTASTGLQRQAAWVLDWIAAFPTDRTRLYVVTGNHDCEVGTGTLADGNWLQRARRPGVHVDNDVVRHRGLTFACKAWNGPLDLNNTVGPVVLVAHAPPEGTLVASEQGWEAGDFEVRQIAESLPCPADSIILSGHAHQPDAHVDYVGRGVACFNSGCNLSAPVPRHFLIDTGARWAWLFDGGSLVSALHY